MPLFWQLPFAPAGRLARLHSCLPAPCSLSLSCSHPPSLTLAVTKWALYAVYSSVVASAPKYSKAAGFSGGTFPDMYIIFGFVNDFDKS